MEKIYNLFDKNLKKLEEIKATLNTKMIDEVYIETEEEGNHYFSGQIKLFGHIFWIEGNSYNYISHVESDEYGRAMFADMDTELDIDAVLSGEDCEIEYKSCLLDDAIKAKLLN